MMKKNLKDAARVIRSKNAGPFELTLDIMLKDRKTYEMLKEKKIISRKLISKIYRIPIGDVMEPIYFDPSRAIKVTMKRPAPSGHAWDSDIYGAQQHAPLLDIEIR